MKKLDTKTLTEIWNDELMSIIDELDAVNDDRLDKDYVFAVIGKHMEPEDDK